MYPPALIAQVASLKSEGKSEETIKTELVRKGWPKKLVESYLYKDIDLGSEYPPITPVTPAETQTEINKEQIIQPQTKIQTISSEIDPKIPDNFLLRILYGNKKFHVVLVGLLIGLLTSIYPSYLAIRYGVPYVKILENKVISVIDEIFPQDLEITIQKGRAKTNVTEPYHLSVSQSTLEDLFSFTKPEAQPLSKVRLVTLNTSGKAEDFVKFQSLAMLTSENLVYYEDSEIKITPLSNVPDMTVDRDFLYGKIREINKDQKISKVLTLILYISPFLITIVVALLFVLEVLFATFLIWIIQKILQAEISFGKLYTLAGALLFLPFLFLINIRFLDSLKPYYLWLSTFIDVIFISISYILIKEYKRSKIQS